MKTSLLALIPAAMFTVASTAIPTDLGKIVADMGIVGLLFYLFMQERKERKELLNMLLNRRNNESKSNEDH